MTRALLLFALVVLWSGESRAAQPPLAPEWDVSEWINGDGRTLESYRGQVVVIDFFQMWCPGCNAFSIPLMERWEKKYAGAVAEERMAFVSIHTVFEGHSVQTPKRLRKFVAKKGIHHLVGIDRLMPGERLPETMKRWRTGGTPEMAVVDKQGRIRFQKFGGFEPGPVEALIDDLLRE